MNCTVCGSPLPHGARFCPNCGAIRPLDSDERAEDGHRPVRQSRGLDRSLARLDPERAREVLGRFYDVTVDELVALRGKPEKFIGDAVMAVFGLPRVHEDDALRAVRAGLAIRARVARLCRRACGCPTPCRSGSASNRVKLLSRSREPSCSSRRPSSTARPGCRARPRRATWSSVRRRERLPTTRPRSVRSDGSTRRASRSRSPPSPSKELSPRTARRTIPFVGRADEMTFLKRSFSRVIATSRPLLFTIAGEPGIGKSRLAANAWPASTRTATVLLERAISVRTARRSGLRRRWCAKSPASRTMTSERRRH